MEKLDMAFEPVRAFLVEIGHFMPKLLLALVILIVGWLIAKGLRLAVDKGLRAINFNVLTERAGVDGFLAQGGLKRDTVGILAILMYWLVVLATLVVAFNTLGLTHVTELLSRIALFIPKVIVAVVILAIGAYFARFVATAVETYCRNVDIEDATFLSRLAFYAIMVFVVLIALDQINIAGDIVRISFLILLAGIVLALAIAFGLGGQKWAADLLERWWPKRRGGDR